MLDGQPLATWKNSKEKRNVDYKAIIGAMQRILSKKGVSDRALENIVKYNTKLNAGTRVFRLKGE